MFHGKLWRLTLVQQAEIKLISPNEATECMASVSSPSLHTRPRDTFRKQDNTVHAYASPWYMQTTASQDKQPVWPAVHNSVYT